LPQKGDDYMMTHGGGGHKKSNYNWYKQFGNTVLEMGGISGSIQP
jgi:hypothetical protein